MPIERPLPGVPSADPATTAGTPRRAGAAGPVPHALPPAAPRIPRGPRAVRSGGRLLAALALALAVLLGSTLASAQEVPAGTAAPVSLHVRTDSPRDLLQTFARLRDELETAVAAYLANPSTTGAARLGLLSDQFNALLDLSEAPAATQREAGIATWVYLLDIFGRVGLPDPAAAPDLSEFEAANHSSWRIPATPLRIVRIADGEREDEFLFAASTLQVAPRFYRSVAHLPLETTLDIESFSAFSPQLTGPLVPAALYRAMPSSLTRLWLGTPLWKVLAIVLAFGVLLGGLAAIHRGLAAIGPARRVPALLLQTLRPFAVLLAGAVALPFVAHQVNVSGTFATVVAKVQTVLVYAACAWLFWLWLRIFFEWIISSPQIQDESLDANLLRLLSGILGLVGAALILAFGGQAIGLPILSVLAGLGIGGLAVALALRPTIENLIGGVILYMDRPVRVGDFCGFGDQTGTVEAIGLRSTKLRALDRTLISVPNAQFADMKIVNWAECDQMLIHDTIGLRYETDPDQLRFVLARLREMLHAHPRIDPDTVRVRFAGYGDSALKVDIRVYAATREWNDFFAVREDVYLRLYDIVREAGTGFAFPAQTLYVGRDPGLDADAGETAREAVARWRRAGRLPFPRMRREDIERLKGTLDYPPRGSVEIGRAAAEGDPGAEPLSAEPAEAASVVQKEAPPPPRRN